ncbi:hypothetical protein GCM10022268_17370 [Sphingomonas cynarae]|uniref:DUF4376 domain-containing protein n=1 Tax=Sphingomonas cynarae TaxID=930197 RepID=A0ABP7DQ05_9SPHN
MFEHFVAYDLASGKELWRGSGPAGAALTQPLPNGVGILLVPQEVVMQIEIDLPALRTALMVGVDNAAERARARFITALPGQVGTYWMKAEVARRWLADNSASTVMLASEATARGMTIADLAAEVVANAEAWAFVADAIEGIRFTAKRAIAEAMTIGAIAEAAVVDWSVLDAPAA